MPRACMVEYGGELFSLRELADFVGMHYQTIKRWRADGVLSQSKIDAYLARRELRATAVRNNVSLRAARVRRWRGWPLVELYTLPHQARLRSAMESRS